MWQASHLQKRDASLQVCLVVLHVQKHEVSLSPCLHSYATTLTPVKSSTPHRQICSLYIYLEFAWSIVISGMPVHTCAISTLQMADLVCKASLPFQFQ